jgi:hypothetical protein
MVERESGLVFSMFAYIINGIGEARGSTLWPQSQKNVNGKRLTMIH